MNVELPLALGYAGIFSVFWCMAVLPSLALAEVPIRTELSYTFLKNLNDNAPGIMSASFFLWLTNLIVPALLGLVLLIGVRIFRTDDTNDLSDSE